MDLERDLNITSHQAPVLLTTQYEKAQFMTIMVRHTEAMACLAFCDTGVRIHTAHSTVLSHPQNITESRMQPPGQKLMLTTDQELSFSIIISLF